MAISPELCWPGCETRLRIYGVPPSYSLATLSCLHVVISFRGSPQEGLGCQDPVTRAWERQLPGDIGWLQALLGVPSGNIPQIWPTTQTNGGWGPQGHHSHSEGVKANAQIVSSKKENSRWYHLNQLLWHTSQKNSVWQVLQNKDTP